MPTPSWREESVTVAGVNVHLYRGGEGPPLVLLHGGDVNTGWLQHHQALAEQCTVYAPSHPGFGHTPGLPWIASIADMALFYLWFLEALGLPRVHLVGHDIGGWLAADMATAAPQVVDRLVLVDAMGIKPQRGEIYDIFLATPTTVRDKSFFDPQQVPEWSQLYGTPPTPQANDRAEEALETSLRLCWKPFMHEPRLPFLLPRLKQPTLIVWGRNDAITPLECGELYRQAIRGAQLHVIEHCGHCPQIEKPQAFAEVVRSFLR
ncbi:MAG: alpha/beta fold hydrolase [Candidatus Tectimicrobiota bacterium]